MLLYNIRFWTERKKVFIRHPLKKRFLILSENNKSSKEPKHIEILRLFCLKITKAQRDQNILRFASHPEDEKTLRGAGNEVLCKKRKNLCHELKNWSKSLPTCNMSADNMYYLNVDRITNLNFYFISVSGKKPENTKLFCCNNVGCCKKWLY